MQFTKNKAKRLHTLFEYIAVILVTGLFLVSVFPIWKIKFQVPLLQYSWDTLLCAYTLKAIIDNGWAYANQFVGAPYGTNLLDFPVSDSLHYVILHIFAWFTNKTFTLYNIYYYFGFLLTSINSFFVFKRLKIGFIFALPGALAFAYLPYHFMRYEHLYLASYYMLPLCLWLFYAVSIGEMHILDKAAHRTKFGFRFEKRLLVPIVAICLLTASSGIYYSLFMVMIGIFASVFYLIMDWSERDKVRTINLGVITLLIFGFTLLNLSPSIAFRASYGKPSVPVGERLWTEADTHGLKLASLVLPSPLHRIELLREITLRYNDTAILVYDTKTASLGFIGVIGLCISVWFLLFGRKSDEPQKKFGTINLLCFFIATIGGFGGMFAFLVNPSLRAYNRISVVIAFVCITSFSYFLHTCFLRFKNAQNRILKSLILLSLLFVVWIDQVYYPDFQSSQNDLELNYLNDVQFSHRISSMVEEDAQIFQLPYMPFPENGPLNGMFDYDHFRPYLYTTGLHWSYGGIKGRESAIFAEKTANLPANQMVDALREKGFSAIYIDRKGYTDDAKAIEAELRAIVATEPYYSYDQRYLVFLIK